MSTPPPLPSRHIRPHLRPPTIALVAKKSVSVGPRAPTIAVKDPRPTTLDKSGVETVAGNPLYDLAHDPPSYSYLRPQARPPTAPVAEKDSCLLTSITHHHRTITSAGVVQRVQAQPLSETSRVIYRMDAYSPSSTCSLS